MEKYLLPLSLLLNSTKGVQKELFFQTRLAAQSVGKEEYLVQLWIYDGSIRFYVIKEEGTGRSLSVQTEQVFDFLNAQGMLDWYRTPSPAYRGERLHEQLPLSPEPNFHSRLASELRPIRQNNNAALTTLGHLQRQVFSLVDGTRGIESIATLLRKDPEIILATLQGLQAQGLIFFQTFS